MIPKITEIEKDKISTVSLIEYKTIFKTDQKNICRYPSIKNLKQLLKINECIILLIKSENFPDQDMYLIMTTNQNKIAYIIIANINDDQFIKKSEESIPLF